MHALAAINTPRRREILRLVWKHETSAGDIREAFPDVTFGAISQHLSVLQKAGLVVVRKDGRRRLYRAQPDALGPLRLWLEQTWDDALYRLKVQAELEEARRGPRPARRTRRAAPGHHRHGGSAA
jgi:DNA-binding transcriptional ArsR family regulator